MKNILFYTMMVLFLPVMLKAQYAGGIGGGSASGSLIASPLPVELISFSGTVENSLVILTWQTATEVNNYGFAIERKDSPVGQIDAGTWTNIGFVGGSGTINAPKLYRFIDNQAAGKVAYRLKQIDRDGNFSYSAAIELTTAAVPNELTLMQNYPNPFNPSTTLSFIVPANGRAVLKIFNTLGQRVVTLFDGQVQAGISNVVTFNASGLASGLYFSQLEFGGKFELKKMSLMK